MFVLDGESLRCNVFVVVSGFPDRPTEGVHEPMGGLGEGEGSTPSWLGTG